MQNDKLTDEKYWETNFGKRNLFKFKESSYHQYLKNILKPDPSKKCIEIGAYPGGNLGYMAKNYGYQPVALDFLDDIFFVEALMKYNGINNCEIIKEDFLKWVPQEKYDIVCSHGFIEHFKNYEEVIKKHVDIVKAQGLLILSVPYLEYYQLWIRKILYNKHAYDKVIASHNRKIMQLERLKEILIDELKLKLIFGDYIKGMHIWFPANNETIRMKRLPLYRLAKKIGEFTRRKNISNKYISPEILIVAQKV